MSRYDRGSFLLVNIAALRARQLMQGATPFVRMSSRKPAAIAVKEIQEGLIPFYLPDDLPRLADDPVAPAEEEQNVP